MQGCAECMPDFAKCRTAEQVPRAEERAFSFPASHSLAPCLSSKAWQGDGGAAGGGWKSRALDWGALSLCVPRDGPGAGSGSHHHSTVFPELNKATIKPASGWSAPSFPRKVERENQTPGVCRIPPGSPSGLSVNLPIFSEPQPQAIGGGCN